MSKTKCHYEVLEVPMDSSADDLKKSYRRLALKWHPDKNIHQYELAEERFKEIQQSYEVLSDPVERSWYDQHRDAILAGEDSSDQFEGVNLWPYFSSSRFQGYGDDDNGFYTVYRNLFSLIDLEERKSNSSATEAPQLGASTSNYDEVKQFYNYWQAFSTMRSFLWKDMYKVTEAPNRQIRRIMEKKNKKERDKSKRQYNELVKKLVTFVKKRDKRVIEFTRTVQDEKLRKEKEKKENLLIKLNDRKQALEIAKKEAEERLDNLDLSQYEEDLIMDEKDKKKSGLIDDEILELYCPACKKKFKSDKQWKNHEKSKKHLNMVSKMKIELLTEDDVEDESFNSIDNPGIDEKLKNDTINRVFNEIYENDEIYEEQTIRSVENDDELEKSNNGSDEDFYIRMMAKSINKSRFDVLYDESEEEEIQDKDSEKEKTDELKDDRNFKNNKKSRRKNKKR